MVKMKRKGQYYYLIENNRIVYKSKDESKVKMRFDMRKESEYRREERRERSHNWYNHLNYFL